MTIPRKTTAGLIQAIVPFSPFSHRVLWAPDTVCVSQRCVLLYLSLLWWVVHSPVLLQPSTATATLPPVDGCHVALFYKWQMTEKSNRLTWMETGLHLGTYTYTQCYHFVVVERNHPNRWFLSIPTLLIQWQHFLLGCPVLVWKPNRFMLMFMFCVTCW